MEDLSKVFKDVEKDFDRSIKKSEKLPKDKEKLKKWSKKRFELIINTLNRIFDKEHYLKYKRKKLLKKVKRFLVGLFRVNSSNDVKKLSEIIEKKKNRIISSKDALNKELISSKDALNKELISSKDALNKEFGKLLDLEKVLDRVHFFDLSFINFDILNKNNEHFILLYKFIFDSLLTAVKHEIGWRGKFGIKIKSEMIEDKIFSKHVLFPFLKKFSKKIVVLELKNSKDSQELIEILKNLKMIILDSKSKIKIEDTPVVAGVEA